MNTSRTPSLALAVSPRRAFGLGSALVLSVALAACSGADVPGSGSCHPSDPGCTSDGGATVDHDGGANTDGSVLGTDSGGGVVADGGQTKHDSGGPGAGDGGGPHDSGLGAEGGAAGFAATCAVNGDCPAAYPVCFNFNAKGLHCTKTCAAATDCPNPPNLGCSGMGVCKIP